MDQTWTNLLSSVIVNSVSCNHAVSGPPSNRPPSLRICARLSALARPIGKFRCLSFHTSSWMTCSNRSQRVGVLARSIAMEDLPSLRLPLVPYVRYTRESERLPLLLAGHCHPSICGLSSGMTRIISCAALLHDRRDLSLDALRNRGAMQVVPVVFRCFHCQDETGRFPHGNPC